VKLYELWSHDDRGVRKAFLIFKVNNIDYLSRLHRTCYMMISDCTVFLCCLEAFVDL
jgi:hypothetical protein